MAATESSRAMDPPKEGAEEETVGVGGSKRPARNRRVSKRVSERSTNSTGSEPSNQPKATEAFVLDGDRLTVGNGQCIAARRGKPSPFGPVALHVDRHL